jgi:hypothetical protein
MVHCVCDGDRLAEEVQYVPSSILRVCPNHGDHPHAGFGRVCGGSQTYSRRGSLTRRNDYSLPKGDFCPFPVDILILTSGQTRTTFLDQSGNVIMELITGPLKVRVTNVTTGESLDLNIAGPGRIVEDGEILIATGPWLLFVPKGALLDDPDFQGLFLTRGRVVAEIDENENIVRFISSNGRVDDICAALAS